MCDPISILKEEKEKQKQKQKKQTNKKNRVKEY